MSGRPSESTVITALIGMQPPPNIPHSPPTEELPRCSQTRREPLQTPCPPNRSKALRRPRWAHPDPSGRRRPTLPPSWKLLLRAGRPTLVLVRAAQGRVERYTPGLHMAPSKKQPSTSSTDSHSMHPYKRRWVASSNSQLTF